MLVATPGQTASYTLHSSNTATKKSCHASSSATPKTSSGNNLSGVHKTAPRPLINKITESSSSTASALMKTLSVRLNRGTEFLKDTVQKALISTTTNVVANSSTTAATNSLSNATIASSSAKSRIIPSSSFLKLYTVPPTATHRYPEDRRQQVNSTDSLHKEMCHFKPIRSAPTTPWKCGSKSRGASLKTPKASLAATKEKINCDDDEEDDDDDYDGAAAEEDVEDSGNEEASDSYDHLRPKPSSVLTTIISTPTHQSAFVCLLAQTKNLAKTQSMAAPLCKKPPHNLHKAKGNRGRTKSINQLQKYSINVPPLPPTSSSFNQKNIQHLPTELIISKSKRNSGRSKVNTTTTITTMGKGKVTTITPNALSSKSRPRNSLKEPKSKVSNTVAQEHNNNNRSERLLRKRKVSYDIHEADDVVHSGSSTITRPTTRKCARLSKDCSNDVQKLLTGTKKSLLTQERRKRPSDSCFTPPLTRSRLKQSSNVKLSGALQYRHRIV